jgi:hypothetical protein
MLASTTEGVKRLSFPYASHKGIKQEYNIKALIPILDTRQR